LFNYSTFAALAVALAAKINIEQAVFFATRIAGISVSKIGTATVDKTEMF